MVNERTIIKLLLVISFVVLSGTVFMPRKTFAEDAAGGSVEKFEECLALAKQGHSTAQLLLADMYLSGYVVPQDYKEAVKWLHKAAEQEEPEAQGLLGGM